ncbi:MAG: hypothetical protein QF902_11410 [Rhodospirillales bacterium]|jgi:hypothetical protein|nr:hypothetical protein [Rhodospirillales bacterium]
MRGALIALALGANVAAFSWIYFTFAPDDPSNSGGESTESVSVQLLAFMVPTQSTKDGRAGKAPVTIIVEVPDKDQVSLVCRHTPRVRDAVLTTLYDHPIPVDADGTLQLDAVQARLGPAIQKALGASPISGVAVVAGVKPSGSRGGAKFAGARACQAVKKSDPKTPDPPSGTKR